VCPIIENFNKLRSIAALNSPIFAEKEICPALIFYK